MQAAKAVIPCVPPDSNVKESLPSHADEIPTVLDASEAPVLLRSSFGALLTRTLPKYTGSYPVGVCDVELPIEPQTFGSFKHISMPSLHAGLRIDSVLFSVFYPAKIDPSSGATPGVAWFPKLGQTIDGFLKMASRIPNNWYRSIAYPIAASAIYGTTFPAYKSPTLLPPPTNQGKWPVLLFSHGVGCSRLMYSAYCGEMASRGYVVVALEHRDGTGPSSTIRTKDGKTEQLDWLDWKDLEWPDLKEQPKDDTTLRHEQLRVRLAEFEQVLRVFESINRGELIESLLTLGPDWSWKEWEGRLDVEKGRVHVSGHSFGGAAALAAAADDRFAFRRVVTMDAATQRLLPWGDRRIPNPLLNITSGEFVKGAEESALVQISRTAPSGHVYIFSIVGATHPAFSDVHLILPDLVNRLIGLKIDPDKVIELSVKSTHDFLEGREEEMIKRQEREKKVFLREQI
ncbi:hypothetical protein BT69DRAFT_1224294 [Atractiella rhizophila]|nr:hypothetical protein BT69DRAFT_1224294 [Atractiella rhizophila]